MIPGQSLLFLFRVSILIDTAVFVY